MNRVNDLGPFLVVLLLLAGPASAADLVKWVVVKSEELSLQVSVPASWKPAKSARALAFRFDESGNAVAGLGILKSSQISDINDAADMELKVKGHPEDWMFSKAMVGGHPAIKIVGTDAKDPNKRFVHYYVQAFNGVYLVQCQAPKDRWPEFSPTFATILSKLTFL